MLFRSRQNGVIMSEQLELFPEDPAQDKAADKEKVAKAKARAAENEEFKDKRVKASPLTVESELAKMREILAKPKADKQEQSRMKFGNPELEKATEGWERKGEKWSPKVTGGASSSGAAQLKNDVLSLSDDDFGSKYGRDRTAKEVATKDANDRAGYKEAEAENKKEKAASRTRGGSTMGGSGVDIEGLKMNKNLKSKLASGGKVKSASSRADGCCIRGKTRA